MGFGNMDTSRIRQLASYDAALKLWESRPPLRKKGDPNCRQLGKPTQKYLWLWKDEDGSIVCHQHRTDVLRYRPDGRIELSPYPSMSTTEIVSLLLPDGVAVDYNHPCTTNGILGLAEKDDIDHAQYRWRWMQEYTAYRISPYVGSDRRIVLRQEADQRWVVENPDTTLIPFKIPRVDTKVARAAYAQHKLADFTNWAAAMLALTNDTTPDRVERLNTAEARVEALVSPDDWVPLLRHMGFRANVYSWRTKMPKLSRITDMLRDDIRSVTPGSITFDEPMAVEWPRLESIRKAQNIYCNGATP